MIRRILLVLMFLALSALPAFAQNFDFPNSPTANEIIAGPAGQALKWDGTKWVAQFGGVGGPFLPEAPLDGNSYLRTNGAWTSGGTLANDLTGSAVHLTNLSGWAPLNFGQPTLTAGTDGAVVASLFAYNKGVGGNNNLNITAGAYMWNGNWVAGTPTAEAIVMNPTTISFQSSTGNTVGGTVGTWNNSAIINTYGLVLPNGDYSSLQFGTGIGSSPGPVASIAGSTRYNGLLIASGAYVNNGTWTATAGAPALITSNNGIGDVEFYTDNGKTVGATYSPTERASINATGMNLSASNEYYAINGVLQPNWNGAGGNANIVQGPAIAYCTNQYSGVVNGQQVTLIHTGVWGGFTTGLLTVWQTFSGAVSTDLYAVNQFGSGSNGVVSLNAANYGGGAAPFTVAVVGATDGGGNPYANIYMTNTSGQTTTVYYWYTPVGGAVYCN